MITRLAHWTGPKPSSTGNPDADCAALQWLQCMLASFSIRSTTSKSDILSTLRAPLASPSSPLTDKMCRCCFDCDLQRTHRTRGGRASPCVAAFTNSAAVTPKARQSFALPAASAAPSYHCLRSLHLQQAALGAKEQEQSADRALHVSKHVGANLSALLHSGSLSATKQSSSGVCTPVQALAGSIKA